eukprot:CAMPEP_0184483064 /NCGR_PEP_ID=MMETSP0113_2-20130426/4670_1 /TAXON_ID=91329 /ORGANISM="Norrisiella sphaerica, Strain BC52" /LENGTH=446 /DNA_ID=CAMNT_0026863213 /DNA_START=246 /DNA_END=1586 /DNA_ORIENTATION=+
MFILPYFLRAARGLLIDRSILRALRGRRRLSSDGNREGAQTGGGGEWHESRAVFSSLMGWGGDDGYAGDLIAWEQRAAPRVTEATLLKLSFQVIFILIAIKLILDTVIFYVKGGEFGDYSGAYCTDTPDASVGIFVIIHFLEVATLTTMVRSLKSDWMGARFYRKLEYGLFLMTWFTATLAMGVVTLWDWYGDLPAIGFQDLTFAIMMVRNTFAFIISHIWVVVLSFDGALAQQHALPFSTCHSLTSLSSVLGDINCMQYFREYLISLSQVETLLCWMEIDLLRDAHPSSALLHATRIWEKYLSTGAALGVSVTEAAREEAKGRLKDIEHEVCEGFSSEGGIRVQEVAFGRVQQELYAQMKSVFGSFLVSSQGRECHERLERQEILQKALTLCGMLRAPLDSMIVGTYEPRDGYDSYEAADIDQGLSASHYYRADSFPRYDEGKKG